MLGILVVRLEIVCIVLFELWFGVVWFEIWNEGVLLKCDSVVGVIV